jgi:hypothetical protein
MGNGMREGSRGFREFRGFGGTLMSRRLKDGSVIRSNDCWSSRAAVQVVPCTEVTVHTAVAPVATAIRLDIYEEIVANLDLFLVPDWEGKRVCISLDPNKPVKLEGERKKPVVRYNSASLYPAVNA